MCGVWLLVILVAIITFSFLSKKEHFGGPIKNMRRIPRTNCYQICGQYYDDCMRRFSDVDANACFRRRESCLSICNYSDFQTL